MDGGPDGAQIDSARRRSKQPVWTPHIPGFVLPDRRHVPVPPKVGRLQCGVRDPIGRRPAWRTRQRIECDHGSEDVGISIAVWPVEKHHAPEPHAVPGTEDHKLHGAQRVAHQGQTIEVQRIEDSGDVLGQAVDGDARLRAARAPVSSPGNTDDANVSRNSGCEIVVDVRGIADASEEDYGRTMPPQSSTSRLTRGMTDTMRWVCGEVSAAATGMRADMARPTADRKGMVLRRPIRTVGGCRAVKPRRTQLAPWPRGISVPLVRDRALGRS
jgi:hypothetical protein